MGTVIYTHTEQLFCDGRKEKVVKDHCCLCHRPMTIRKVTLGNCCFHCNERANKVARWIFTPEESDHMLNMRSIDLEEEIWIINGENYVKMSDNTLLIQVLYDDVMKEEIINFAI